MRVLVVDDYSEVRDVLKFFLNKFGIVATECASGNEAIGLMAQGEEFQLIISDYQMADGDGLAVLEYLHKTGSNSKFMLFTSALELDITFDYEHFLGVFCKDNLRGLFKMIEGIVSGSGR